jgi:predicted ester cyclase
VSEALVVHQLGKGEDADRQAFEAFVTEFAAAVPDLRFDVESTVAEGDEVVVHLTVSGTPQKPVGALRPTGESFTADAFHRYRIEDGRIAEAWLLPNGMGIVAQLGLLPDSPVKVVRLVVGRIVSRIR